MLLRRENEEQWNKLNELLTKKFGKSYRIISGDQLRKILKENPDILNAWIGQNTEKGGPGSGRRPEGGHEETASLLYNSPSRRAHYADARRRGLSDVDARRLIAQRFGDKDN